MTESRRATRAFPLALAILVAAGGLAVLLAGPAPTGGSAAKYPDAAEIPTDGRRVEALGPAPLGALGAALQLAVVLACPAICLGMGFLRRFEDCGHPAAAGVGEDQVKSMGEHRVKIHGRHRPAARRQRWKRRLMIGAALAVLVSAGVGYLGWNLGWTAAAEGDPAPPFVLPDHQGRQVSLADYLGRQPVVLLFYMTYT